MRGSSREACVYTKLLTCMSRGQSYPGDKIDRQEPFPKGRYTVVKLLVSGTYGKVVEAEDNKYNKTPVALKLVG